MLASLVKCKLVKGDKGFWDLLVLVPLSAHLDRTSGLPSPYEKFAKVVLL